MRTIGPGLLTLLTLAVAGSTMLAGSPAAAQAISKGPYVLRVGETEALLRLETTEPATFEVALGLVAADAEPRTFEGVTAVHADEAAVGTLRLSELEPDTRYEYTIRVGNDEARGELWTAPPPGTPFTFLVYGDVRTRHRIHRQVVELMLEETDARMALHTGDFVEMGGRPADWTTFFEISAPLFRRVAIFPSLGNHELYGPGGLGRYHRYMTRGDTRETWYRQDYGDLVLIALDSNVDWDPGVAQVDWLTAQLADIPADRFILLFLHHGPFSSGRHGGHGGMQAMDLPDQLRAAGVDLIFSGHDHDYERGDADGLKYVVTGGGGAPLYHVNEPTPYQLAFEPAHHFLRMRIEEGRLFMRVIRADGSLLESCSFAKGESWACEDGAALGPITPGISRSEYIYDHYVKPYAFYGVAIPIVVGAFIWAWRRRRRSKDGDGK